jgi:hypothetical protein
MTVPSGCLAIATRFPPGLPGRTDILQLQATNGYTPLSSLFRRVAAEEKKRDFFDSVGSRKIRFPPGQALSFRDSVAIAQPLYF